MWLSQQAALKRAVAPPGDKNNPAKKIPKQPYNSNTNPGASHPSVQPKNWLPPRTRPYPALAGRRLLDRLETSPIFKWFNFFRKAGYLTEQLKESFTVKTSDNPRSKSHPSAWEASCTTSRLPLLVGDVY